MHASLVPQSLLPRGPQPFYESSRILEVDPLLSQQLLLSSPLPDPFELSNHLLSSSLVLLAWILNSLGWGEGDRRSSLLFGNRRRFVLGGGGGLLLSSNLVEVKGHLS